MARLPSSPCVAVVGAGPGGLMAAEVLASAGARVTVYEAMRSPGRKLLLAGRGGLNITHSEPIERFLARYGDARPRLEAALDRFGPEHLRAWCAGLGEETFVGSSGRVFPASFRATPLLRAWLRRLDGSGVVLRTGWRWHGWDGDGALVLRDRDGTARTLRADATVLALGGASWPRTGSDGKWAAVLRDAGITVTPLRPANCGFTVAWSAVFAERFAGTPLKNVRLVHGGASARGDAVVTRTGLEGGAVYALSRLLRDAVERDGAATVHVDLRPDVPADALAARLAGRRPKESGATVLRRAAGLHAVGVGLLREATGNRLPSDPEELAALVKAVPVRLVAPAPIDRAISTAGGVALDEVDEHFMLRKRPGTFVAGEMLDWEAPTGGYLLQATFATAVAAAEGAIAWLARRPPVEP